MVAWKVDEKEIKILGDYSLGIPTISHSYHRPTYVQWPYAMYTMIHGKTQRQCDEVIEDIKKNTGITQCRKLATVQEFKKVREDDKSVVDTSDFPGYGGAGGGEGGNSLLTVY